MQTTFITWAPHLRASLAAMALGVLFCAWPSASRADSAKDAATPSTPVAHAYRCTDAGGRIRYSQWPCPDGDKLADLADHRTTTQRRHAFDALERDEALLRSMERQRHHQEKLAAKQGAASLSPRSRPPAKVGAATSTAHLPVPLQRCRPPKCFTVRAPTVKPAT